jgi:SnoaL-like domain
MSTSIADLMRTHVLSVFNERDPDARRAAIARTYQPDVVFSDHDGVIRGHDAIDEKVQGLLDRTPGFVFRLAGPVRESNDLGMLDWLLGPEGAAPVVRGTDIALVRDDKIAAAYTFVHGVDDSLK